MGGLYLLDIFFRKCMIHIIFYLRYFEFLFFYFYIFNNLCAVAGEEWELLLEGRTRWEELKHLLKTFQLVVNIGLFGEPDDILELSLEIFFLFVADDSRGFL